jgi:hypothetical protein
MLSGHFIGAFIGVSRRDKSGVLLLRGATPAEFDLAYVHSDVFRDPTDLIPAFDNRICDGNLAWTRRLDALSRDPCHTRKKRLKQQENY